MKIMLGLDEWYSYHSLQTQDEWEAQTADWSDEDRNDLADPVVEIPDAVWEEYKAAKAAYQAVLNKLRKFEE